jgi:hypothetical protein
MTQTAVQKTHGTATIASVPTPIKSAPSVTLPFKTMYLLQITSNTTYQEIEFAADEGMPGRPHPSGSPLPYRPATNQTASAQAWYWDIEALSLVAAGAATVVKTQKFL